MNKAHLMRFNRHAGDLMFSRAAMRHLHDQKIKQEHEYYFQAKFNEFNLAGAGTQQVDQQPRVNRLLHDGYVNLGQDMVDEAMEKFPGSNRPTFALMRHTAVYDNEKSRDTAIAALQGVLGQFENLFRNLGDVENGFPRRIPLEELTDREQYNADMLEDNLMFGSPETVINKLKRYEALGVDEFIYYASMGLGQKEQKRSLELFCEEVLPAFN